MFLHRNKLHGRTWNAVHSKISNPSFLINFLARYDVELYQRIEQLIEKRLPKFDVVEEEVMMLVERVTEAQRFAKMVSGRIFSSHHDYLEYALQLCLSRCVSV